MTAAVQPPHTTQDGFSSNNFLANQRAIDARRANLAPLLNHDLEVAFKQKKYLYCNVEGHIILLPKTPMPPPGFMRSLKHVIRIVNILCVDNELIKILHVTQRINFFFNVLVLNRYVEMHNAHVKEDSCLAILKIISCCCVDFNISPVIPNHLVNLQQSIFKEILRKDNVEALREAFQITVLRALMIVDEKFFLNFNSYFDSDLIFEMIRFVAIHHLKVNGFCKEDKDNFLLILTGFYNTHRNDYWGRQLFECIRKPEYLPFLRMLIGHISLETRLIMMCEEFLADIICFLINQKIDNWEIEEIQGIHELAKSICESKSINFSDNASRMFSNIHSASSLFENDLFFYDIAFCNGPAFALVKEKFKPTSIHGTIYEYLKVDSNIYTIALNVNWAVRANIWNEKGTSFGERMQRLIKTFSLNKPCIDALMSCFREATLSRQQLFIFLSERRERCIPCADFINLLLEFSAKTLTDQEATSITHIQGYFNSPQVPSPLASPISNASGDAGLQSFD